MRIYVCDNCGYESERAADIALMPDGMTEYCEPCYKGLGYGK